MIQFMRGNSSSIISENPVLAAGQPFFETDTNKLKIGDGTSSYNSLDYIGGAGSASWDNITGKPSTYPPSEHTHEIDSINGLKSKIDSLDSLTNEVGTNISPRLDAVEGDVTSIDNRVDSLSSSINSKMNTPTNTGSSNQWLKRSNSNQGTWSTLPTASASQAGMITTALFTKLNSMDLYVDDYNSTNNNGYVHYNNNLTIEWRRITISNLSVTNALGSWYRSESPYGQSAYSWVALGSNTYQPLVQMSFVSTNNASAMVWINPVPSLITRYVPECYLIRPTTGTCNGYLSVLAIGTNSYI